MNDRQRALLKRATPWPVLRMFYTYRHRLIERKMRRAGCMADYLHAKSQADAYYMVGRIMRQEHDVRIALAESLLKYQSRHGWHSPKERR